jgi:hypothetical protein
VWGGWLSKKPFQKGLAMHGLTFDPGQRRVLLLVNSSYKTGNNQPLQLYFKKFCSLRFLFNGTVYRH